MGSSDLITVGAVSAVVGTPVAVFAGMVGYKTVENLGMPGWIGPAGMLSAIGAAGGLVMATKISSTRRQRRAAEQEHQRWINFRNTFDPSLWFALDTLYSDLAACMMWTHGQIGVGLAPNPNAGFPGTWPRLLEGQDPGHPWDPGVRATSAGARVRLLLPQGYSAKHIYSALQNLTASLAVPKIHIVRAKSNVVVLELRVRNPLADSIPFPTPEPSPVPLHALRVAMREDWEAHRLRIWNNHLFLAGLSGSGKSGVLWSIIGALAPDIKAGRVELHMIDLKRGTEMAAGYRLYASWGHQIAEAIAILEKIVKLMHNRADPRREHSMRTGEPLRNHVPEPGDPHHVLMIDEVIALLKLLGDRKGTFNVPQLDGSWAEEVMRVDKYVVILLLEILSQGRAFGITVIVATQNAAKEIFETLRDMFATMIGLRQASEQQVMMVYGPGAHERGIEATGITVDEAGTAYIDSPEEGGMAQRVRFFKVTNDDIIKLVKVFGRPEDAPMLPPLSLPQSAGDKKKSNVVELRRGEQEQDQEPSLLEQLDQLPPEQPGRCRFCGSEIKQIPGGRPLLYCRGTDHRQQYNKLRKRLGLASGD
ncbi:FtsK/SpoIIIE domain-containing protein [Nocardia sp. NPDC003963]